MPSSRDQIDLFKEIVACGNPGFNVDPGDKVTDMRLI